MEEGGGGLRRKSGNFGRLNRYLESQSQSTLHIFYAACFHSYFHTHEQLACDKNFHYTVFFFIIFFNIGHFNEDIVKDY